MKLLSGPQLYMKPWTDGDHPLFPPGCSDIVDQGIGRLLKIISVKADLHSLVTAYSVAKFNGKAWPAGLRRY